MEAEKNLKNALPANLFVNARLEPSVLKGVMDDINKIDPRNFKDIDLIGRVYEYFLQQFAVNATKEDGEFYTPQSIVELIAHLIEPYDGTIYDPCCGSGGMFVQSVRLIEAHGGNKRNVSVYGQESDPDTYRLAKMNLAARGISYHWATAMHRHSPTTSIPTSVPTTSWPIRLSTSKHGALRSS